MPEEVLMEIELDESAKPTSLSGSGTMDAQEWVDEFENAGGRRYNTAVFSSGELKDYLYGYFGTQLIRDRFAKRMRADGWKVDCHCMSVMGTKQFVIDATRPRK
jgi:hypothetical protein